MVDVLLLTQAAATLFLVGLIWFVQIVHYPLMARVPVSEFAAYEHEQCCVDRGCLRGGIVLPSPLHRSFCGQDWISQCHSLAFALLTIGYFTLGALPYKTTVLPAIVVLMFGGSFIKSIITGTVAKTSTTETRARAFSIFYGMANVGSFTGKSLAYPIRIELGLEAINYYSAFMTFLALVVVYFFYKNVDVHGEGKTAKEAWEGLVRILEKPRLLTLILIVTGFWIIQHQM